MASHTVLAERHGWTREQIEHLAEFENRSDFTPAEKAALRLAERMTSDSNRVSDQEWQALRGYYDEGQIIELAAAIGLFNYFNRFNNALRMEPTR